MKLIKFILLLSLFGCYNVFADTKPQQYAVEIILFSQLNQAALTSEHWPFYNGDLEIPNDTLPWPVIDSTDSDTTQQQTASDPAPASDQASASASDPTSASDPNPGIATVLTAWDPTQWQLNKAAARIKRSRFYNLLEHTAFVVTTADLNNGILVHLNSLDDIEQTSNTTPKQTNNTTPEQDSNTDLQASNNGLLAIKLDHYFNLKFNFVLAIPTINLDNIYSAWNDNKYWGDYSYFHFLAERRMRSREINYIDFPLMGIIVLITPLST